jgi:hypothetical protein|nr:MAG TPA: head to tail adaptor [Caudoviricetes sp.]
MILSVERAKWLIDFKDWPIERIEQKLKAIEQTIRSYTNNNFQNRKIRSAGVVSSSKLNVINKLYGLSIGDTVQITESMFNDGLYTVKGIEENAIVLDKELIDECYALITKVEYPDDVIECCINLCEWEVKNRGKVGIKVETLSRHSVTYFDQDASNQMNGYPVSLLGCLKPYRKARC